MTSRDGPNRARLRQTAPNIDPVLTPLGRPQPIFPSVSTSGNPNSTSLPTTVIQNSGNVRLRRSANNLIASSGEVDSNSSVDPSTFDTLGPTSIATFDAEQFRSDIKANGNDEKRLEQLVLNAINYFINTSKRSSQQIADYTVLTFLAWTVSLHGDIFRLPSVIKAMCTLLKGSTLAKTLRTFPQVNNGNNVGLTTTPYTLVCQILWAAFKVRL